MGLFSSSNKHVKLSLNEERLYEIALDELEAGEVRKGLYARALVEANGDKDKVSAIYLKIRVESLKEDIKIDQANRKRDENVRKPEGFGIHPNIENAKKKAKAIGCYVEKPFFEKFYYVIGSDGRTKFKTTHLVDLNNWLDKNINE